MMLPRWRHVGSFAMAGSEASMKEKKVPVVAYMGTTERDGRSSPAEEGRKQAEPDHCMVAGIYSEAAIVLSSRVINCLHFVHEQVKLLPIAIQNVNLIYLYSVDVLLLYRR